MKEKKTDCGCKGCRWHDDFIGVCFNDDCDCYGDFTFVRCELFEETEAEE